VSFAYFRLLMERDGVSTQWLGEYRAPMTLRSGLTLVEVVVAMLIFSVGALGLAAGSAVIIRQMAASQARMHSASSARSRAEQFSGSECASLSNGEDRNQGVRSTWQVTQGAAATLDQQMERVAADRIRTDRYLSAVLCD
jgi:prepilin-type N-terminal cleavage/methylation domain-containing protein